MVPFKRIILVVLAVFATTAFGACTQSSPGDPGTTTTTTAPSCVNPTINPTSAPPTIDYPATPWTFTLRVGMSQDLITKYGGVSGARAKVDNQLAQVNSYFGALKHPVKFSVKELYAYTQSAGAETSTSYAANHNGANYLLLYSENTSIDDGGWYPWNRAVVIRWLPTPPYNGVFGQYGADSVNHELGHARGAIDLYALTVRPKDNPVNGVAYTPEPGFMSTLYGATGYDAYDAAVIDASTTVISNDDHVVWQSLPPAYNIVVQDSSGAPVCGANVSMYPVSWQSNVNATVSPTASFNGTTGSNATLVAPPNPFGVGGGTKWNLANPMQLVTASSAGKTGSAWLTLPDAGLSYFAHANDPYTLVVKIS